MTPQQLNALSNTPKITTPGLNLPHSPMPGSTTPVANIDSQLQALADIHLPDPINWWPPAPGWWIVLFASLLLAYFLYKLINKKLTLYHFRKQAKNELQSIKRYWKKQHNLVLSAAQLSVFMRRLALSQLKNQGLTHRASIASLSDQQWLNYLQQQPGMNKLGKKHEELLIQLPYQDPLALFDRDEQQQLAKKIEEIFAFISIWIKKGCKHA